MEETANTAQVTHAGLLDMQVCVPASWTDEDVLVFANWQNPAGTTNGWGIRKTGDERLLGKPERVSCRQREGFVHVMLDA